MIFFELLNELIGAGSLVDIRRDDLEVADLRGFVLAVSAKLVLIGVVGDDIQHDGYTIIEQDEITFFRWGTDYLLAWERVLERSVADPSVKEVDISTWWEALEGARLIAPLVTFYRERSDPSTCYLSDQFRFSDASIAGCQVTTDGQRNGFFAIRSEDLTRVEFGGRYETGLHRVIDSA